MDLAQIKDDIPSDQFEILSSLFTTLRPAQAKAIKAGLFRNKSLLVCTPTASGKTLIAELAAIKAIKNRQKAVYIVPLKALASEKYKEFQKRYSKFVKIALSIGNLDSADPYLADYDMIIATAEKMDSLLRHHAPWISEISCLIIDEIHLLNDVGRGPTLEILITLLRQLSKKMQLIGLSATIGNPKELADWLGAELVEDSWRPVKLKQGVYFDEKTEFKGS